MKQSAWAVGLLLVTFAVGACQSKLKRRVSNYERTRNDQAAEQLLKKTVQQEPENAEAQFLLGTFQLRHEKYEEAYQAMRASREASPKYVERANFFLEKARREQMKAGLNALDNEQPSQAVQHFTKASHVAPRQGNVLRALGYAHVQAGQPSAAIKAYRSAVEAGDAQLETFNNLAALTFRQGDYAETITYTDRALDKNSENRTALSWRAHAYSRLDQWAKAEGVFRKIMNLGPSRSARRGYAIALFSQNKHEEALPLLRSLTQTDSTRLSLVRALGETYYALENYPRVIATYQDVLRRKPDDHAALVNLSIAFEKLGKADSARAYRRSLSQSDSPPADSPPDSNAVNEE